LIRELPTCRELLDRIMNEAEGRNFIDFY
jgi:hypothetical protein